MPPADSSGSRTLAPVTPPLAQSTAPSSASTFDSGALSSPSTFSPFQASQAEDDGEPPSPGSPLPATLQQQHWLSDQSDPSPSQVGLAVAPDLGESLGWLAGGAIALLTLLIPMGSVLLDRSSSIGLGAANSSPTLAAPLSNSSLTGAPKPRVESPVAGAAGPDPDQLTTLRSLSQIP